MHHLPAEPEGYESELVPSGRSLGRGVSGAAEGHSVSGAVPVSGAGVGSIVDGDPGQAEVKAGGGVGWVCGYAQPASAGPGCRPGSNGIGCAARKSRPVVAKGSGSTGAAVGGRVRACGV